MVVDPICKMDVDEKMPNGSVNTRARSITSVPLDARKNSKKPLKNMPKNKKDDYLQ